ncbi:MAG TPA: hypothetical protein VK174_12375 [Chitinophagales bacterium]|nr:hypothetical protein [Chitinophagales bacterium]
MSGYGIYCIVAEWYFCMLMARPKIEPVYVALALCAICWSIIMYRYTYFDEEAYFKKAKENAIQFQAVELNGRIRYINNKRGFIMEGVNEPLYYGVKIEFDSPNRDKFFLNVASPGDSLIKHAHSDSLVLFTKNKTYQAKCISAHLNRQ